MKACKAVSAAAMLLAMSAVAHAPGEKEVRSKVTVPRQGGAAEYTIIELGTLSGGQSSGANAINGSGEVVGGSATGSGDCHAFVWQDGVMRDLGTLGGFVSGANDINDAGQVVGWSDINDGLQQTSFLWEGGVLKDLGSLGGVWATAVAINNSGQIVGCAETWPPGEVLGLLWQNGAMTPLGTLGGQETHAYDINDAGQVVGWSATATGAQRAFLWEGGSLRDLGTLGGQESEAWGINDAGQVVGEAETGAGSTHAFIWQGGVVSDLGTLGGGGSGARDINDHGQVVGWARTPGGDQHAFLHEEGVMRDLNECLRDGSGWVLKQANGINNAGQVVGSGMHNGLSRAFVATPVEGVGSLVLDVPVAPVALGTSPAIEAILRVDNPEDFTITAEIIDPDEVSLGIFSFAPKDPEVLVRYVLQDFELPDSPAGRYTVEATAADGSKSYRDSATFEAIESGVLNISVRESGNPDPADFFADQTVYIDFAVAGGPPVKELFVTVSVYDSLSGEAFLEYARLPGEEESPFLTTTLEIPALPVFDPASSGYGIHRVAVWTSPEYRHVFDKDRDWFRVINRSEPELVILTSPSALRDSLGGSTAKGFERLTKVLELAKNSPVYNVFVYKARSEDSSATCARLKSASINFSQPDYLLIIGGDHVIPYGKLNEGRSDQPYWDIAGDLKPELRYGRLPTFRVTSGSGGTLTERFPKAIFEYLCERIRGIGPLGLDRSIVYVGRDSPTTPLPAFVPGVYDLEAFVQDRLFREGYELAKRVLVENGVGYAEYELLSGDLPMATWNSAEEGLSIVRNSDVVWGIGHGGSSSVLMWYGGCSLIEAANGRAVRFHVNRTVRGTNDDYRSIDMFDDPFKRAPLAYLAACDTAGYDTGLAEYMMYCGSGGCAGFGKAVSSRQLPRISEVYMDGALSRVVSRWLGDIHHDALNELVFSEKDVLNLIQYGNPLCQVGGGSAMCTIPLSERSSREQPLKLTVDVVSYSFEPVDELYETLSFMAMVDQELVESSPWLLQGNPLVPHVRREFTLPPDQTIQEMRYSSTPEFVGLHNLPEVPPTNFGGLVEHYPLGYETYMPEPVILEMSETGEGRMRVELGIFPFQYTPSTGEVVLHDDIQVDFSYGAASATIESAFFEDDSVPAGTPAILTVQSAGSCDIVVAFDRAGDFEARQAAAGSNTFVIPTENLHAGTYTLAVRCEVDGILNGETSTAFRVFDRRITIDGPVARDSALRGQQTHIAWKTANKGTSSQEVELILEVLSGNQTISHELETVDLGAGESKVGQKTISTREIIHGLATFRIKAVVGDDEFCSGYCHVIVSDWLKASKIEVLPGDLIRLTFGDVVGKASSYRLESSPTLGAAASWTTETDAMFRSIGEGVFEAEAPMGDAGQRFYRVVLVP